MKQSIHICKLVSILFLAFILLAIPCMGQKTDLQKENIKGHVLSVTGTEYNFAFKFGEYERGNAKVTSHKFFDENGMIYKKSGYDRDVTYYTYTEGNKPLSIITYSPQSVKYNRFESTIDSKSRIVEYEYNNGILQEYNEYTGRFTGADFSRHLWRKGKYSYDSGKIIVNIYEGNGSQFCRKIITTSGNSKTVLNLWGNTVDKEEYLYNSSGLLIQSEQSDSVLGRGFISRGKIKYKYEANDDLIRETHGEAVYVFKYEYDSHHNWVVRKKFLCPANKDTEMISWVERNIQYADSQEEILDSRKSILAKDSLLLHSEEKWWKQKVDSIQRVDSINEVDLARLNFQRRLSHIYEQYHENIPPSKTIKNILISEDKSFTFVLEDGSKMSPMTFQYRMNLDSRDFRLNLKRNFVAYYTKSKDYAILVPMNGFMEGQPLLIHFINGGPYSDYPYIISYRVYSKIRKNLKKLEEIAAKMELRETSLDESLKLFDEGVKLVGECMKKLDECSAKVTELSGKLEKLRTIEGSGE